MHMDWSKKLLSWCRFFTCLMCAFTLSCHIKPPTRSTEIIQYHFDYFDTTLLTSNWPFPLVYFWGRTLFTWTSHITLPDRFHCSNFVNGRTICLNAFFSIIIDILHHRYITLIDLYGILWIVLFLTLFRIGLFWTAHR